MDQGSAAQSSGASTAVRRRTVLKSLGATGVAAAATSRPAAAAAQAVASAPAHGTGWNAFASAIEAEFRRMDLVGAAVAVVSADRVLHRQPLGVRDLTGRRPVTNSTHFLVASTTKSMTSLLAATYVDAGKFGWDQPVAHVWPQFRAPTEELTRTLRVRDLFGMASGIGEPPALSGLHEGDPTAAQLLQSLVNLPVVTAPGKRFIYNNTVYGVGGYLPMLQDGVATDVLTGTYAELLAQRVFRPAGMYGARITDDPRGLVGDFARPHGLTLSLRNETLTYGPVGSYAPVGGALATLDDMAGYVRLHLRRGMSVTGRRVVSAGNLAECWKPHIRVPISAEFDPDVVNSGYAMGWIRNTFRDGTSLVWHNGAIDGFTAFIGFLPERDIGLVVLNSMNPVPTGLYFYLYVLNTLLSQRFGLNDGVPGTVHEAYMSAVAAQRALGERTGPVSAKAVTSYLGYDEGGYRVELPRGDLQVRLASRVLPVRARKDGGYVIGGGVLAQNPVRLFRDVDDTPRLDLVGVESVRRTVGLD